MSAAWKALLVESAPTPMLSRNCERDTLSVSDSTLKCWEKRRQGTYQHCGIIRKKAASKGLKLSGINPMFLKKKA